MTVAVATAEEVDALRARVEQLAAQLEALAADRTAATDRLSPRQVARRLRVRDQVVYAACESGRLIAEQRSLSRGRTGYLIRIEDARRWHAAIARTNQ